MKFDTLRSNYLRSKGSYSRPGRDAKKKQKADNMKEEHGAGDFGTDELTNKYKNETPGQQTEAKATMCGRCGTKHVKPSEGGTCPALQNEQKTQLDELSPATHQSYQAKAFTSGARGIAAKRMGTMSAKDAYDNEKKRHAGIELSKSLQRRDARKTRNEEIDSTTSAARKPVKVKVNGKEVVRMQPVKNNVQTESVLKVRGEAQVRSLLQDFVDEYIEKTSMPNLMKLAQVIGKKLQKSGSGYMFESVLNEKTLTKAELKKREEIAQAIERDKPDMPMDKKMAIATAAAKRVEEDQQKNDLPKKVKLKGFGPDNAKGNMGNPSARAALKPKMESSEVEQAKTFFEMRDELSELSRETLGSYASKASDASKHRGMPTKKVDNRYTGVARASKKLDKMESVEHFEEAHGLTPQHIKQGIGIARDKRYAGGNMTGATKAMDKIHPKLADHPRIQKELQKQNEAKLYVPQSDPAKEYSARKAKERSDMNKKNDPGAAKKGLALSVTDRDKARTKAKKKGISNFGKYDQALRPGVNRTTGKAYDRKLPESRLQTIRNTLNLAENAADARAVGKELADYAKKNGGIDKAHMMDMSKDMIRSGKLPDKKHMNEMDTDVREVVYGIIFDVMGEKGLRPYGIRMK